MLGLINPSERVFFSAELFRLLRRRDEPRGLFQCRVDVLQS